MAFHRSDADSVRRTVVVRTPAIPKPPTPKVGENYSKGALPPPPEIPTPPSRVPVDIEAAPTFTPYTVRPDITNRRAVAEALEEAYPSDLREAGVGGTVQVWFFITDQGTVRKTQVNRSSGSQALDDAALKVANTIQFTPAMNRDEAVPVWISLPITFTTR
jgi:protein TonB